MFLQRYCFAAVLITVATTAVVDVEKTVKQVENILKSNKLLPRLTRNEIIDLLNDIRAEDAKSASASSSRETSKEIKTIPYSTFENEVATATESSVKDIVINNNNDSPASTSPPNPESTTKKGEPSVMFVLPYTPRDGSSLQELYTRPPRVEVVALSDTTPNPTLSGKKLQKSLTENAKIADKNKMEDFPAELQAFLDAHGLKGKPGQDHFLLPLEGFKPLPPAKIVDGNVQLPENILLTYDLISPSDEKWNGDKGPLPPNNFLYEPLRPEYPFELDTSSSETKESIYPLDIPKIRKPKSAEANPVNYEPLDYESVKVIPLNKGINPVEETKDVSSIEQNKRQANETQTDATITTTEEAKSANESPTASDSSASADTDNGASIADLEDSFGGAAPQAPGDSELPPPRKNGFYWMLDWNSFLEVGDGDSKVNIRFEPKLGDPQMFLPVTVP